MSCFAARKDGVANGSRESTYVHISQKLTEKPWNPSSQVKLRP